MKTNGRSLRETWTRRSASQLCFTSAAATPLHALRSRRQLVLVSVLWPKCTPRQHFAAGRLQSGSLEPRRLDIGLCWTAGYPQPAETGGGTGLDKASGPSPAPLDQLSNSERARHKNVSWFLMAAERVESIAVHSLFITFTCSIVLFQYLEVLMCTFTQTV